MSPFSYKATMVEKEFNALIEELDNVTAFVEEQLEALDCPMKIVMQIDIAVEEIFVNIAHYAYGEGTGTMKLAVIKNEDNSVSIRFTDSGVHFDPLAKEDPDINLDADDRAIGGLGIFMVKKSMDSVDYKYENGQNVFTMTKKF